MKGFLVGLFFAGYFIVVGQSADINLDIRGDYTSLDSAQIVNAFAIAHQAVIQMHGDMDAIWNSKSEGLSKKEARRKEWLQNPNFTSWLGIPEKIGSARRKINRIKSKFEGPVTLTVTKENKGRCTGWISAWTIPYGKIRIRLCEDYFIYRTHLQEKVLIHEMGHEAGILFHRKIHGCRAARRAAISRKNTAKRSPENYAWLAMSYVGLKCAN